ncbi:MAG: hypothetical protein COB02_07175 [Candidatus Cloacimonadota bacterium]|nr:MAG: hypothetical protein COB02_07175 [Candidatus Cloacimonadota bacterium]
MNLRHFILLSITFFFLNTYNFSIGLKLPTNKKSSVSFGGFQSPFAKKQYIKINDTISHESIELNKDFYLIYQFNMDKQWHIYGTEEKIGLVTKVKLENNDFEIIEQKLSPSTKHQINIGDKTITSYFLVNKSYLVVKLKAKVKSPKLKLKLIYQPCTQDSCMMPTKKIYEYDIKYNTHVSKTLKSPFLEILKPYLSNKTPKVAENPNNDNASSQLDSIMKKGWIWAILTAFFWGLLASLTPCVYPMIPITVSLFSGDEEEISLVKRLSKAIVYVLGIVLVYAMLGMLTAKLGQDLGSWMAKPIVVIPIVFIMLALSLSMFGLFELDLPPFLKEKLTSVEGDNYFMLFLMGGAMGFVAAPCVGPFAGAIIGWLIQNPNSPIFGFFLMASFGLGMGTLFLVIAVFSQNVLPKSGMWMVRVKQIMGYVLIGMAFYFAKVFFTEYTIDMFVGIYILIAGSLMGAFVQLTWDDDWWKKVSKALGLVLFLWGTLIISKSNEWLPKSSQVTNIATNPQKPLKIFHDHDRVLRYAKKTKKPSFMYFGAKWCIPCRIIKKKVLKDPKVMAELSRFSIGYLDCTDSDSKSAKIKRDKYKSVAMPYFIFYDSKGNLLKKLEVNGKIKASKLLKLLKSVK